MGLRPGREGAVGLAVCPQAGESFRVPGGGEDPYQGTPARRARDQPAQRWTDDLRADGYPQAHGHEVLVP